MLRQGGTIIIGLTLAATFLLAAGPTPVESRPSGETGGRYLGSRIAAGTRGDHTCAVKEDGTVFCWGSNSSGQLGNGSGGSGQFSATPVQVQNLQDAVAVTAGPAHSCALRATGNVVCWGANGFGTLGDGTSTARSSPVLVQNPDGSALSGVVSVAAGFSHTCAVRVDGTARCWGSKSSGALGTGESNPSAPFILTSAATVVSLTDAVSIAAGASYTCAVRATGAVACWGGNFFGELGRGGGDTTTHSIPGDVPGVTDAIAVAAGTEHACALRVTGVVRCWGNNSAGQIGDGTFATSRPSPTTVGGLNGVVLLALGDRHSCARRADGDVRCWGGDDSGQLGDLGNTDQPTPGTVISSRSCNPLIGCTFTPLGDADGLAAGHQHGCSLQVDDKIRCWGNNEVGQLGGGNTTPQFFAASLVVNSGGTIGGRTISAGTDQTCARRADGTAPCWDSDLTPAAVPGFTRTLAVATGGSHKCALRADGLVQCVGRNQRGQVGNGQGGLGAPEVTTAAAVSGLTDVAAVAAGQDFTCALQVGGGVRCWGANAFGQLGNVPGEGFSANRFEAAPVTVQGLTAVIGLAAGREHACAVRVGGTVHCWGFNVFGQTGAAATNTLVTTPVQVPTISTAVAVTAGPDHSCALLVNGTARCWGKNDVGQLGNGQATFTPGFVTAHPTPSDVIGLGDAVSLAAGGSGGAVSPAPSTSNDFTCARRVVGGVQCWGDNAAGQLGDNSTTDRLQPQTSVVQHVSSFINGIPITLSFPLSGVSAVTAGNRFGCALVAAGRPFCWGSGTSFALPVSSFAFNVDPSVALFGRDRVARVTALANCPSGEHVQINASLTQDDASGRGIAIGACTGQLERYEVIVPAHGRERFAPGPAVVEAEAIIRSHGRVLDHQEWTRAVNLQ